MYILIWARISLLAAVLLSAAAHGQSVEENESELLRPLNRARAPSSLPDVSKSAEDIVQRTNEFRQAQSLSATQVDAKLRKTAQYFADFMARTDQYGHNADGQRPAGRVTDRGYDYCIIAENIAYRYRADGFETHELAQKFFKGWKSSPEHRQNMLDPDVTETGVAISRSDQSGYYYAVQLFGRQKSKAIEFTIANHADANIEYKIGERVFDIPPRYIRTHERCRPSEVTFRWPGSKADPKVVQPQNGDRFTIEKENEAFRLKQEESRSPAETAAPAN